MFADVLVIGAGVAGLSCARALQQAGMQVQVLDKGRGVGGRCATRRVEGQAVDHGVGFLHGTQADFLEELRRVDARPLWGWPYRVLGEGTPCQPQAFKAGSFCVAFEEGVSAFPKHLAQGLQISLNTQVLSLERTAGGVRALTQAGAWEARALVVAVPVPQALALLGALPENKGLCGLLSMVVPHPSLTLIAGYALDQPELDFDMCFPQDSRVFQTILQDSTKRAAPQFRVMVAQARPSWSQQHLLDGDHVTILSAALADVLGKDWAKPVWAQAHRWRYATLAPGMGVPRPYFRRFEDGYALGVAGDAFDRLGGVEGAYFSGLALAASLKM